jgi:hydrogenase maturation protease
MALDMSGCSLVVFVDADRRGLPGSIAVQPITADAQRSDADRRARRGASSHHLGGTELVALATELADRRPEAVQVGVGVVDLELGEGLSPTVEASLPRVVEVIVDVIERHRAR